MLRRTKSKSCKVLCLFIAMLLLVGAIPIQVLAESNDECIVAFDPDDGRAGYKDFYKTTVRRGDKITDIPEDPKRDGYFFAGWYAYTDESGFGVYWDFESDVVEENMTLWAEWDEGYIVAYDTDDGGTGYKDFYKTTVHKNDKITDIPEDPKRDGYFFKGWYAFLDEDGDPVYWDFDRHKVTENTTLWAGWEEGYIVAYDPDDGKAQYQDFYKTTVHKGDKVTDIPEDPKRDGYFFRGWYAHLEQDENDEKVYHPVYWDFENDVVEENTTLWADWEEGCIVAYDPDDGKAQYQDFYKTMVHKGDKVTDIPEDPKRDGYFFKGWYFALDADDNPVYWDFENDVVEENTTLWADWEEGCIVAFDPRNGTEFEDFYKTTVRKGDIVTDIPEDPERDGYVFKGWYLVLDEDGNPVHWDFENDVVSEFLIILCADWDVHVHNITKSSNVDEISVGKSYIYTITVTCSPFADIWENVLAKDVLADELDYVGFESEDGVVVTANGEELDIDFGDINKGESKTVIITVKVNSNGKTGQVIENKVITNDGKTAIDPNGPKIKEEKTSKPNESSGGKETIVPDEGIPLGLEKDAHIAYIQGYPEGDFRQENPITRAEAAQIFYNLLIGVDKTGYSSSFSDVGYNSWYSDAINCLSVNNIILGYPDGTFRPDAYITRAEFATLASKFDELSLTDTNQFKDVLNNHWAIKYINSAAIKGWIKGYENGEFRPDNNITRAETVTLVNSILQRKINIEDIPKDARKYSDLSSSHWAYCDITEASDAHSYERKEGGLSEIWITIIK